MRNCMGPDPLRPGGDAIGTAGFPSDVRRSTVEHGHPGSTSLDTAFIIVYEMQHNLFDRNEKWNFYSDPLRQKIRFTWLLSRSDRRGTAYSASDW